MEKSSKQTGPKTAEGKVNSSKNSTKFGIFSASVTQGEDAHAVQALIDDLRSVYKLNHGAGEVLGTRYVHTNLQLNRLQQAQIAIAKSKFYSAKTREKFCIDAGLYYKNAETVPDWYFNSDQAPRQHAMLMQEVFEEAHYLKNHYSPDLMTRAQTALPNLWKYVMGEVGNPCQKVFTLGEQIGNLYKKPQPQSNMQELIVDIEKHWQYELLWAQNAERYEAIIQGLRAQALVDTLTEPGLVRAESLLHKRSQELLSTMHLLSKAIPEKVPQPVPMVELSSDGDS